MQDTRAAQIQGGDVVRHMLSGLPYYTVPDDRLAMGASLGNSSLWVTTKGTGAIERVFSCNIGQSLINAVSIRYAGPGLYRSGLSEDASEGVGASSYLGLGKESARPPIWVSVRTRPANSRSIPPSNATASP